MVAAWSARLGLAQRATSEERARQERGTSDLCRQPFGAAGSARLGWLGSSGRCCLCLRCGSAVFFGFSCASLASVGVGFVGFALAPLWVASLCLLRLRLLRHSSALANSRKKTATASALGNWQQLPRRAEPAKPSRTSRTERTANEVARSSLQPRSFLARCPLRGLPRLTGATAADHATSRTKESVKNA